MLLMLSNYCLQNYTNTGTTDLCNTQKMSKKY